MSSARLQDYIEDVSMDIDQKFYPLPLITIPNIIIRMPQIPEYHFENERKAICDYENDKASKQSPISDTLQSPCSSSASTTQPQPHSTALRKARSAGILEPSRAPFHNSLQKANSIKPCVMDYFEEFETKPNLFDLVEMHTIDDKAALEEVLLANTPFERRENASDVK